MKAPRSGPAAAMSEDREILQAYTTKRVDFRYRGIDLRFSLSHGLFSSADIDSGSRFLLKTLSARFDEQIGCGRKLPRAVLDSGSGVGVLGIAAARALIAAGAQGVTVRAQDRDELARVFSAANAEDNGLGPDVFSAFAERMLAGPVGPRYDLILSNLPAKAGHPVLADFFFRSSRLLSEEGKTAVVIVNTLADSARLWLRAAGAPLLFEEQGSEHTVFFSGPARPAEGDSASAQPAGDPYLRAEGEQELEKVGYKLRALHGVADFSEPSRAVAVAAKLAAKLGHFDRVLAHEIEQGHFPAFLAASARSDGRPLSKLVLCARNVLALEAARENCAPLVGPENVEAESGADLGLAADRLLARWGTFDLVATFPELVPRTERLEGLWEGAAKLVRAGGCLIAAFPSSDAARFDKLKTKAFNRADDLKRDGFRALAYRRN